MQKKNREVRVEASGFNSDSPIKNPRPEASGCGCIEEECVEQKKKSRVLFIFIEGKKIFSQPIWVQPEIMRVRKKFPLNFWFNKWDGTTFIYTSHFGIRSQNIIKAVNGIIFTMT